MKFYQLLTAMLLGVLMNVSAYSQTATIKTDLDDYPPGATVYITGTGFSPNESVTLQVLHVGETGDNAFSGAHAPWVVTADASGNVSSSWYVPLDEDELGATLLLTADGQSSGLHAEWTFTDANVQSVSVGAQTGSVTYGTGGSVSYTITVNSNGNTTPYNVVLSISGLPAGVSSPGFPLTINNVGQSGATATLNLNVGSTVPVPVTSYSFTVTATNGGTVRTNTGSLTIVKKTLTGSITANNKVYDGTPTATIASRNLTGVVSPDIVSYTGGTAVFGDKNVGNGKTVTASGLSLAGANAGNYDVNTTASTTANISAKNLTVTATGNNKTYNGNTLATVNLAADKISTDVVNAVSTTANFIDKNVGNGKTINITGISINGADAGNYSLLNTTATATANITALGITGSFTADNKVYDGNTNAVVLARTPNGIISPDDVTLSGGTAAFSNKDVANGKTVTLTGAVLGGTDVGNYSLTSVATTTANITPKSITYSITAADKVYDATVAATITSRTLSGVVPGDVVNPTGGTATFSDKNVGNGKTVTAIGLTLGGGDKNNYSVNTSATASADITAATLVPSIVANNKVYDGTTTATLSSQTVSPILLTDNVNLIVGAANFADANAGTGKTVTASSLSLGGADAGNYVLSSSTATALANITKADATVDVSGYSGTYDGAAHGASGSATGVGGTNLNAQLDLGASFTDVPGGTANWSFSGGTNYNDQNGSVAIVINKADPTIVVTPYSVIYDATAHTATSSANGVENENLAGLDLSGTTHTDAGSYTDSWTFTDVTGNYNNATGTVTDVIAKANAVVNVNGYTDTYDALPHGATGAATGVGGVDLTTGLNLGASFTDVPGGTANWTFSGGNNYNDQTGSVDIIINKANATVTVNGYTGVYDATAHGATGSAIGVGGVDLSGGLNLGSSFTDVPGGTANWSFSGGNNYNDQSGSVDIIINKANATVTVNGYTGTYDATAHGATGTATGVGGVDLSSSLNLGVTFTNVPGGTANWSFDGGTNYNDQSGSVAIVINKADPTIVVTPYNVIYDATAHTATGTAKGVVNENLAGLNLSGTTHTDAGTYNDSWTFTDLTGNYNNKSGTVTDVIAKADAVVSVSGFTGTYDATAHGATGTATGVGGVDLSSVLNLGASFTDVPGGTAHWTFTGGTNYNDQSGDVAIEITKANATVTVSGYTGTYDGTAHGATGTATGVGGVSLPGLNLGANFTDVPGGTANWTFTGGTNYNDQSGSVAIIINKANAIVNVNGYTGVYDGQAHGASGTATGVGSATLVAQLNLGATFINVPGGTAHWTFTGGTNYYDQSGDVAINISKKPASVTPNAASKTYGTADPTLTGTLTGFVPADNVTATYSRTTGESAAVTYTISAVLAPSSVLTNYDITYNTAVFTINNIPINATVTLGSIACNGGTTTITVNATGGDGALKYSLNNGAFVSSNQFTVSAGVYTVTIKDEDGFTKTLTGINVTQPTMLTATISTNNPTLYFGYTGDQTATITAKPTGGTAPYKVTIKMVDPLPVLVGQPARPIERSGGKLICDYINTAGDEVWTPGTSTASSTGTTCATNSVQASSTSTATIGSGGSYSVNVTLLADARFVATVTDANGCTYDVPYTQSAAVDAEDVRCFAGNSTVTKVTLCHKTGSTKNPCVTICVDESAVAEHIAHGDFLGKCTSTCTAPATNAKPVEPLEIISADTKLSLKVIPNPSVNYFNMKITSGSKEKISLRVIDIAGRVVEKREGLAANSSIMIGQGYTQGLYIAEITQGNERKVVKIIKEK